MTSEEFKAAIADTVEKRGIQVREVTNGYMLVMTRQFLDQGTGTTKFSINIEGVAGDLAQLDIAFRNFFTNGDPAVAAPLIA